ncbi:AAA-domain-containing protein [Martensiomyces pterosporus]|nr:AAA-domain-containing protein [Martensiomyces pterosporus]
MQHGLLIPVPTRPRREQLAGSVISELAPLVSPDATISADQSDPELAGLFKKVANATAGYVARDIACLCRQSFLGMLRGSGSSSSDVADMHLIESFSRLSLAEASSASSGTASVASALPKWHHFADALQVVRPSQQLEFESALPTRRWSDIGGYTETKQALQRFMRLATSETPSQLGVKPPTGILLYGPTGCGKTAMALAMLAESSCNVICIRGSELFSKYLGETEARLRRLFHAARAAAPCVIFMDEVDSIAAKREWSSVESGGPALRVLSTLLNEMDGVHEAKGVIAVGCTNQIGRIDDAMLRPAGRFDQLVEIRPPTLEDRVGILHALAHKSPLEVDVDMAAIAGMTSGFSGANLEQLFREAGLSAMRASRDAIALSMHDFMAALDKVETQGSGDGDGEIRLPGDGE